MRSSRSEVFCKKGGLQLYLKKTLAQVFSCEFYEIFKNTFYRTFRWLLLKTEIILDNYQNSERDLVVDIFKKRISNLEVDLQQKNLLVIDYMHSQLSLKATDNILSSSATRNLNGTSTQDSVGDNK